MCGATSDGDVCAHPGDIYRGAHQPCTTPPRPTRPRSSTAPTRSARRSGAPAGCGARSPASPRRPPATPADAPDDEARMSIDVARSRTERHPTTEHAIMDGVAVHATSRNLIGRDAELAELA